MADLLTSLKNMSYTEKLQAQGYTAKAAEDMARKRQQRRQKSQLRRYKRQTERTSSKLMRRHGIESDPTPKPKGRSWGLWDVFDLFYIFEYPIFNAIKHTAEGDDIGDILVSMFKGLTLQEKTSGDDLLESLGMSKGTGRSIGGLLLEIAGNPINWFGGPLGLTKLGKLSKLKTAGALQNLKEGGKLTKAARSMFPWINKLDDVVAKIPGMGATFGEQAKLGQRALITFKGKPVVQHENTMEMLGSIGAAMKAWTPVQSFLNFMGHISTKGAHQLMRTHIWFGRRMGIKYMEEAAEVMTFLERAPEGTRKIMVQLLDDPQFAVWAALHHADKAGSPANAMKFLGRVRKAATAYTKSQPPPSYFSKGVMSTLRTGHTEQDAKQIIRFVERMLGPKMAKNLNVKNSFIKDLMIGSRVKGVRGGVKDVVFNPHFLDEYLGIMASPETMRHPVQQMFKVGDFGDEMVETLGTMWAGYDNPAMKGVFDDIVQKMYKFRNSPGRLGTMLEGGASSEQLFSHGLAQFIDEPMTILAQNPELFFFYQSFARMSGVELGKKYLLDKRMLQRASNTYQATAAMHLINQFLSPGGMESFSDNGRKFLTLFGAHIKHLKKGKLYKGPIARINAIFNGDVGGLPKNIKDMKSLFGTLDNDLDKLIKYLGTGGKQGTRDLVRSGMLTEELAFMVRQFGAADRWLIEGRLQFIKKLSQPLLDGHYSNTILRTVDSYKNAKAVENVLAMYMLQSVSIPGAKGARFKPSGHTVVQILDDLRAKPGYHVDKETYRLAEHMRKSLANMRDIEAEMGILTSMIPFYFPRYLTREAAKRYGGGARIVSWGKPGSRNANFMKHRQYLGVIDEVNQGMRDMTGIEKFFIDDPAIAYAMRAQAHTRVVSNTQMMTGLANNFGTKIAKGAMLLPEEAKKFGIVDIKGFGNFKLPKDVVQWVEGYQTLMTNQAELQGLRRAWSGMVSWWKGWTLGVFPAYHARNFASNLSQMWIAGMRPNEMLSYMTVARRIQKYGPGLADEFFTIPGTGQKVSLKLIHEAGMQRGIPGSGLFSGEMPEILGKGVEQFKALGRGAGTGLGILPRATRGAPLSKAEQALIRIGGPKLLKTGPSVAGRLPGETGIRTVAKATVKAVGKPKGFLRKLGPAGRALQWAPLVSKTDNQLMTLGFLAGRGIENNHRWALFLHQVAQGHSYDDAAMTVAKFLFDYTDVNTVIARGREAFPFIVWSRKNIPLQLENLIMRPSTMAWMVKGKDFWEKEAAASDLDTPDLPQFIRENVPMAWRKESDGTYRYFMFGNWLALTDLERVLDPHYMVINALFPGLRLPMELMSNHSFFFHTNLDRGIPGETRKFLGIDMSPKTAHVLRSLRVLNEANRLFGLDDNVRENTMERLLRFTLGTKLYPVDPEEEMLSRYRVHSEGLRRQLTREKYKRER